jgi:hypothetical protein
VIITIVIWLSLHHWFVLPTDGDNPFQVNVNHRKKTTTTETSSSPVLAFRDMSVVLTIVITVDLCYHLTMTITEKGKKKKNSGESPRHPSWSCITSHMIFHAKYMCVRSIGFKSAICGLTPSFPDNSTPKLVTS